MQRLSAKTRLRRVDDLHVHIHSGAGSRLDIRKEGRLASTGPGGLAVLDVFRQPCTVATALDVLKQRTADKYSWGDVVQSITRLYRCGFLVVDADDGNTAAPTAMSRPGGWGSASAHIAMLGDRQRTESYLAAVRAVVRPGDVVVDMGAGTGVLSVAAAQAGASHVYAIEASGIGTAAEAIFRANGCEDRITLIGGVSAEVELPERADVLLSEVISHDVLSEGIVGYFADARRRLLKTAARFVPSRVKVLALPVALPEKLIRRVTFTSGTLDTWRSRYGIDFSPLQQAAPSSLSLLIDPMRLAGRVLGTPVLVFDANLATADTEVRCVDGAFTATESEYANGVLICFDAELAPGIRLTTHPDRVGRDNHWSHRAWVLAEPVMLEAGRRYHLSYSYQSPGRPDGAHVAATRRASTPPPGT